LRVAICEQGRISMFVLCMYCCHLGAIIPGSNQNCGWTVCLCDTFMTLLLLCTHP
jgi:hypothetical protein